MTDLIDIVQKTALDDAFIELFDITISYGNNQSVDIHLIDGLDPDSLNIWMPYEQSNGTRIWAEYLACPIAIEGISIDSAGAISRPTLSIANIASMARSLSDYSATTPANSDGFENETNIDAILKGLNIVKNEDVLGSIVQYRKTLLKNTFVKSSDAGSPAVDRWYPYDHPTKTGDGAGIYDINDTIPSAIEFSPQRFILDRIAGETNIIVQFELANPLDVQGLKIPNRYVIGKYCPWEYKGAVAGSIKSGCPWKSDIYTTRGNFSQGTSYSSNDVVVDNGRRYYVIGDPSNAGVEESVSADNLAHPGTWGHGPWFDIDNANTTEANDSCGKTIQACKLRFHPKGTAQNSNGDTILSAHQNTEIPLPFGGFPGSRKFK